MESGTLVPAVKLDGYQAANLMSQLSHRGSPLAEALWKRVHQAWQFRGMAMEVTVPLSARELRMVTQLGCSTKQPGVVDYRYLAIYRHPELNQEVRVRSQDRPAKRRTFRITGHGRKKFVRKKLYRIKTTTRSTKESQHMAKAKTKTKKKQNTKDVDDDLEDELEGLEELEDLEDEDVEEPEAEEDEDEEEETPKKKRAKKTSTKGKAAGKRKKKAAVVEDDEEDEEDEEEEDEEPAPKKKGSKKAKSTKTTSKKKSDAGKKGAKKGTSAAGKTTAEATGGVGSSELAAAASEIAEVEITGRDVRVYLRSNEIPKDEEHGRYVWPSAKNKEFRKLAKAIAAEYEDE